MKIKKYPILKALIIAGIIALMSYVGYRIFFLDFDVFIVYLAFVLPLVVGILIVDFIFVDSGYKKILDDRLRRPDKAGLAVCISSSGRVLMNRQTEEPWKDYFLLPGGYFRPELDKTTGETAKRRLEKLTGAKIKFRPTIHIADLDIQSRVVQSYLAQQKYKFTVDNAWLIERDDGNLVDENEITQDGNLRWIDLDELEENRFIQYYMRELVKFVLSENKSETDLHLWNLTEDGRDWFKLNPKR
jgi:ADP-ribose pyrophosphatase YjhB (NUDIX family)